MARARSPANTKPYAANPLKSSAPLGAALAFLGMDRCLPLLHGSQGCTAFALVLLVRHFREAIPLQTTAMNELTTILGGMDNVEEALGTIFQRAGPRLIGLISTALTETRGEDMVADLRAMRSRHPDWQTLDVVPVSAPDYHGALETGWSRAVTAMIETLTEPGDRTRSLRQVNLLPGSHLGPGDVDELRGVIEAFGLDPVVLPDLAGSLDGRVPDRYTPTTLGGTRSEDVRTLGRARLTIAVGEQMRAPAQALHRLCGVPFAVYDRLTGLDGADALVVKLAETSGVPVPPALRRDRSRLLDAMLDCHMTFAGKRVALAGDPDLLIALGALVAEMGATVIRVVASTPSPVLARLPAQAADVGDLDDLEQALATDPGGCDLLIANSHGQPIAQRLGMPLYRAGFPVTDRFGVPHRVTVGYRGTRSLLFDLANGLLAHGSGPCQEVCHDPFVAPAVAAH